MPHFHLIHISHANSLFPTKICERFAMCGCEVSAENKKFAHEMRNPKISGEDPLVGRFFCLSCEIVLIQP